MAALSVAVLALALTAAPTGGVADPTRRWSAYIAEASSRFGLPESWIRRVMRIESGGRTALAGRPVVSRAGAMGLMQVMPRTWFQMRCLHRLGVDPFDPHDNILAGAAYLRAMYDRFGYPGLFGAYNAGPARYGAFVAAGRSLPPETRAYLAMASAGGRAAGARMGGVEAPGLFVRAAGSPPSSAALSPRPGAALFVALDPYRNPDRHLWKQSLAARPGF